VLNAGLLRLAGFARCAAIWCALMPEMFGGNGNSIDRHGRLDDVLQFRLEAEHVQNERGRDSAFLNTAWRLQVARDFGQPMSSVYAAAILPYVIAVLSFSAVVSGFESTKFI
jgi:hypothetical protein